MSHRIVVEDVHLRYGEVEALRGLSFEVPEGSICGLLGRNGSGKTSVLSLLAGRRRPTSGRITIGGRQPFEDAGVMGAVALVGDAGTGGTMYRVEEVRGLCRRLRPRWDDEWAGRLLDRFEVPAKTKVKALSRGKRAALGVVCALASGADVTLLDEAHLGMDAPSRAAFYDEVLAGVMETGRTVILATHHIDEVSSLFGEVVIIDQGRPLAQAGTDELRGQGTEVTGPADAVDAFTADLTVLSTRSLGRTRAAVVYGPLDDDRRHRAEELHLDLGPLPLQDLFIHLTEAAGS